LKTDQIIQHANQRLTDKIKSVFSLTSALIPIVAGLGYFIAKETNAYWILFPISICLSLFVFATALGIGLFRPSNFEYVDPKFIVEKYRGKGKSYRFFVNKWASTICDTANKNAKTVNAKENKLNLMYFLVVMGLAVLTASFLFLALSVTNILHL
jgi:hypothetical protein